MWYQDSNGNFQQTTDPERMTYEAMLQELQLWKKENPMNVDAGIDYEGVFNNTTFIKTEVQSVLDKYEDSFEALEVGDVSYSEDEEVCTVPISVTFKDGTTIRKSLEFLGR